MSSATAALLEFVPDPVVLVSAEGHIQLVNKAFAALVDSAADDLRGRSLASVMGEPQADVQAMIERCCRTSAPLPFAAGLRTVGGELARFRVEGLLVEHGRSKSATTIGLRLRRHVQANEAFQRLNEEISGLKREIQARKAAEAALRLSEARYRDLIHGLPAAVYACDREGRILIYNQAAVALWGVEPRVGHDLWCGSWKIYRPDGTVWPLDDCPMAVTLREGRPIRDQEIIIERPDGTKRHVLPHPEPIKDEHGELVGALNMLVDITERKQAEEQLRQSEARKSAIFESALDCLITMDADGRVQDFNQAGERLFGYSREQAVGRTVAELIIPPKLREAHERGLRRYLETGHAMVLGRRIEMPGLRADGQEIPVELAISVTSQPGQAPLFTAYLRDLTERKQAEQAIANLAAIVTSSDDAIVGKNLQGIVTTWNRAAERLFGYTADEMVGQSGTRLIPPDRPDEEPEILRRLARGQPIHHYETVRRRKDGTDVHVSLSVSPVVDSQGRIIGASKIARDITEQKRVEAALRERDRDLTEANEALSRQAMALKEANKELEQFSYSVSHDLRAPLRTIDAFSRIVLEDYSAQLDAEGQRCLNIIRKAAGQGGELIDDLLELSRLGRQSMRLETVAMAALVQESADGLQLMQTGRKCSLIVADLPPCHGDRRLLKIVWTNLLSNAFKYTKYCPEAAIEAGWMPDDLRDDMVVYYVKDNGVGFDIKYVHKLFGVFQRLHNREDFEGTGVGLAIVQRIIHRHGGRVWAEGKPDGGATFYLALRKAPA